MRWTVKEVARAKGIRSARELGEKAGVAPNSVYKLWNGTARMVGVGTLEKLCAVLEVPVGMLLQYIPGAER
ncbi:MAG TPA: helix-turn-helix transcriptional regulator [Blastocatellia bacterium]|nr:helix-turn-helix transcriptional regulator [Blastocatellia bacterium]